MTRYINPFTDFGFKKIFGEETSKNILLDFINALLPSLHIKHLTFKNSEQLPSATPARKAIYDIYCENENGEKFIVELQKANQSFFKERMLYYSTFPINVQVEMNNYKFDLKAIYCIGILDFIFNDGRKATVNNEVIHTAMLKDQNGEVFYDKLTFIYVEMPKFSQPESELETRKDKWLYFIRNLDTFKDIPEIFVGDAIFMEAFKKAEAARLSPDDHFRYVESVMVLNDWHAILDTAVGDEAKRGNQKVRELELKVIEEKELAIKEKELAIKETEKKAEKEKELAIKGIAKAMKISGISIDIINKTTGVSNEEIGRF